MNVRTEARIVLAPASFKGSLTAAQAAGSMAEGVCDTFPSATVFRIPLADGGEGLVHVLAEALRAEIRQTEVAGPLPGQRVLASWAFSSHEHIAVIETAAAAGITLVPEDQRDPGITTTYGVGELLRAALTAGATRIYLGLGGSATNDGGAGMAEALGIRLLGRDGKQIERGGRALLGLKRIESSGLDERLSQVSLIAACDVSNPLNGPSGATAVFAPQKGARREDLPMLDEALRHLAGIIQRDCGVQVAGLPGAGAAGGLGAGVVAFCGGRLRRGIEVVLEAVQFDDRIRGAELIITGEGRLDRQTLLGKVIHGVTSHAGRLGIPVAAVVGSVEGDRDEIARSLGLVDIAALAEGDTSPQEAMRNASGILRQRTAAMLKKLSREGRDE